MFEHDITEYVNDGRLCEPNDGIRYRMREMADEAKRLGRPLTEEEADKYKEKP